MPHEPLWTGSQLLRKLLCDFLSGKLEIERFCRDVEVAYNNAIDERALTTAEQPIFEKLFDEVAWFSPFAEEREEVPHLRNEEQILRAALSAESELGATG
jgi:hypothetical protein